MGMDIHFFVLAICFCTVFLCHFYLALAGRVFLLCLGEAGERPVRKIATSVYHEQFHEQTRCFF